MSRYRYRYNPERLEYEKVPLNWKDYLWWTTKALFIVGVISASSILIFNAFYESPRQVAQKEEIRFLKSQVHEMQNDMGEMEKVMTDIAQRDDAIYRNIFGAKPYPDYLRKPGIGGTDREKDLKGFQSSDLVISAKRKISELQRMMVSQSRSFDDVLELARNKNELLSSIPAIQPVRNEDLTRVASGYGWRIHPIYKVRKMHTGMDFTANTGTEIFATGDGVVKRVERKSNGYGRNVIIQHGYGYETLYAHMSEILVHEGQKVKRGEVIGLVGNTGTSVGPHLHYEVIKDGKKVNPAYFYFNDLTPEEFEELLDKAHRANQSFD